MRSAISGVRSAALLALALSAVGCREPSSPAPERFEARPGAPVVLISIDTLRSDRLPAYGYGGVETPAIDRLRDDGILFERAYCHTPLTLPSHVSLLTGQLPTVTGVRDNAGYRLEEGYEVYLPRLLRAAGYKTGAMVSTWALQGTNGLAQAFDVYDDRASEGRAADLWGPERPGPATLAATLPWLEAMAEESFFLFFHLYEPHLPYTPPEPFRERYGATYEAEIAAADAVVGDLLAALDGHGIYDDALIVLLSDHGEGLGDHDEDGHGILLYREALQVPLILKPPAGAWPAETGPGLAVDRPAQLVDVAPTVLELLGLPVPEAMSGDALSLLLTAAEEPRTIFSETLYARLHYGWSDLTSVIRGRHHLIDGPRPELFDLVADPGESEDVLRAERGAYQDLRERVETFRVPFAEPAAIDPEEAARLEALGYLATTPREVTLADPREQLVKTAAKRRAALQHFRGGDFEAAVPAFQTLLEDEPLMVDGWQHLGIALGETGRHAQAVDALKKAVELSRGSSLAVADLTRALVNVQRFEEALEHAALLDGREPDLARAARRTVALALIEARRENEAVPILRGLLATEEDEASLSGLALALVSLGEIDEAEVLCHKILALDPEDAMTFQNLGLIALERGDPVSAREFLNRSVRSDRNLANSWNLLGVARAQTRDFGGALQAWERAVALDGEQWDALYNLAFTAAQGGLIDQARHYLEQYVQTAPPQELAAEIAQARQLLARLPPS